MLFFSPGPAAVPSLSFSVSARNVLLTLPNFQNFRNPAQHISGNIAPTKVTAHMELCNYLPGAAYHFSGYRNVGGALFGIRIKARVGWRSKFGGFISAISSRVIPSDQTSAWDVQSQAEQLINSGLCKCSYCDREMREYREREREGEEEREIVK